MNFKIRTKLSYTSASGTELPSKTTEYVTIAPCTASLNTKPIRSLYENATYHAARG